MQSAIPSSPVTDFTHVEVSFSCTEIILVTLGQGLISIVLHRRFGNEGTAALYGLVPGHTQYNSRNPSITSRAVEQGDNCKGLRFSKS